MSCRHSLSSSATLPQQNLIARHRCREQRIQHLEDLSEFEVHILARQLLVDRRKSVDLVLHSGLLILVQVDFVEARTVELDANALAHDLSGVDEVIQSVLVDSHQGAAPWALLFGVELGLSRRLRQDLPLSNDDEVLSAELLLELADESRLDLLELGELWHGHEQDDGLLASRSVHLARARQVQLTQLHLEVTGGLEVEHGLGDLALQLGRLQVTLLDQLGCSETHLRTTCRRLKDFSYLD